MAFRRRDPELALQKSHEKMVEKIAAKQGADSWFAALSNEMASAKTTTPVLPATQQTYTRAQSQYVFEEAAGLERDRPSRGRRSVQPDGHGHGKVPLFSIGGIWSARRGNAVDGRVDYGRWPETSIPPRGTPTQHNYGPPLVHRVEVEQPRYEPIPYQPPPGGPRGGGGCTCGHC